MVRCEGQKQNIYTGQDSANYEAQLVQSLLKRWMRGSLGNRYIYYIEIYSLKEKIPSSPHRPFRAQVAPPATAAVPLPNRRVAGSGP